MGGMMLASVAALSCSAVALAAEPDAGGTPSGGAEPVEIDLTAPAPEPSPPAEETTWLEAPAERRCGFTFGLALGAHMGNVSGFPLDALKVGRDEHEVDTGFSGGGSAMGWVGLAPTDWIVFAGAGSYGRLASSSHGTEFGAVAIHLDAFPLFFLGDAWRDLGVTFEGGIGVTTSRENDSESDDPAIDSGAASRISAGIFYEGVRAWKISMGPFVSYDMMWSPSVNQPTAWIGWRSALYAGP